MIICICNNINCAKVREAVDKGCKTSIEVLEYWKCKHECKSCVKEIKKIIEENYYGTGCW